MIERSQQPLRRVHALDSRLAALKDIKPALAKLYAALSAEQK